MSGGRRWFVDAELLVVLAVAAALFALMFVAIRNGNAQEGAARARCAARGGTFIIVDGQQLCLAKGTVLQ